MKTGRSVPALHALPRSAKALATNPAVYARAVERSAAIDAAKYLPVWLTQDRIPYSRYEPPFSRKFLERYYAEPASIINSADGKPATREERNNYFEIIERWQLGNRTHPEIKRPHTLYMPKQGDALKKIVETTAAAALAATGAYFLGNAVMAGNAATAAASAAGAPPATAAAVGASTEAAIASGATALAPTVASPAVAAGASAGAATASAASSLLPIAESVLPAFSMVTGIPVPTSLTAAGLTQYATEVAVAKLGESQRDALQAEIARQQAALVAEGATMTGSNPALPPELRESQARHARMTELAGWAILGVAITAVLRRSNR